MRGRAVPKRFPAKAVFHRAAGPHDPHDPPQLLAGAGGGGRRPGRRSLWGLLSRLPVCVDATGIVTQDSGAVICFVPLEEGKQVQAGMSVILGEGEREAQVTWVKHLRLLSGGPGSPVGRRGPGRPFPGERPVVAVECSLDPESALQPGALFSCSIVVEEKAPLAFLLPSPAQRPFGRFPVRGGVSWRSITRKYPPCSRWRPRSATRPRSP